MQRLLALLCVAALGAGAAGAKSSKSAKGLSDLIVSYEIEGAGTGIQGTYLVQVTIVKEKATDVEVPLRMAAVHGVLFRGFAGYRQAQKPLAGSAAAEAEHADFFSDFFSETGSAVNYASIVSGSTTVTKMSKNYQITATLTVQKDQLREYLEDAGVIKSLNSIF